MSMLVIDITQEEINYANKVELFNIVGLSMTDILIKDIYATERLINFFTNGKYFSLRTPTRLRTFLHRFHYKAPVFPIRIEVKY